MDIYAIPREAVGLMIPVAGPHLMRGLTAATDLTLKEVVDDLVDGSATLWVVGDDGKVIGAFLTAVFADDDGQWAVDVYALGGNDLAKWGAAVSDTMAAFAKANGAVRVVFAGRKALKRIYPNVEIVGQLSSGVYRFERAVQ